MVAMQVPRILRHKLKDFDLIDRNMKYIHAFSECYMDHTDTRHRAPWLHEDQALTG